MAEHVMVAPSSGALTSRSPGPMSTVHTHFPSPHQFSEEGRLGRNLHATLEARRTWDAPWEGDYSTNGGL